MTTYTRFRLVGKSGNIRIVYSLSEALALIKEGFKLLSSGKGTAK